MRTYLGADYARKLEISQRAKELRACGVEVTSTWHDSNPDNVAGFGIGGMSHNMREAGHMAEVDIMGIRACDRFVLFTTGELSRGGRHTEYGIAKALNKLLVIVGVREHAFHCLSTVDVYDDWEQFMLWNTQPVQATG